MDVFQDCLVKPRTDEQYLSKTVNDRTRVIAFITASRIIIPASGVWYERFCFLTCDTLGAQIKIPVRGVSRISRESRVVSMLSHCSLGERKVPGFCGWQALLFRITMKSSAFEGPHTVLSYDPSHAHSMFLGCFAGTSSSSLTTQRQSVCFCREDKDSSCDCVLAPICFPKHSSLCLPLLCCC